MEEVKVIITIDTEEDEWGKFATNNSSVENIKYIPALQKIFKKYGAIPTYFLTYPVISNVDSRDILRKIYENGECEIGVHCHPWNTPPLTADITPYKTMLCNLPTELIREKLEILTFEIKKYFGSKSVISFRAGRWGFSSVVAECLVDLGFKVDSSITPFVDWTGEYGPNFSNAPYFPYKFSPRFPILPNDKGELVEIPPTIGFLQKISFKTLLNIRSFILKSGLYHFHLIGVLDKLKLMSLRWLSPENTSKKDIISLAKSFINHGVNVLNMTFHSTSLMPGKTPFVKTDKDKKKFLERIEVFLKFAKEKGFKFVSLSHMLDE